eukprot:m.48677 g.48677  ORF g.48677 m.48677 type:complete len:59 (-) comp20817_c0_seq1:2680-2856(-)
MTSLIGDAHWPTSLSLQLQQAQFVIGRLAFNFGVFGLEILNRFDVFFMLIETNFVITQ